MNSLFDDFHWQISAEFGQKSPSSGLGPGPGPGGGVSRAPRQRSRVPDVKAPPRTPLSATTSTKTRSSSSRSTPPLSTSPAVNASRTRTATGPLPAVPASGLKQEIFFLNIEEGYFGCQVNESTDVLQLYDISKLCNGVPECFLGSDENRAQLKCTSK